MAGDAVDLRERLREKVTGDRVGDEETLLGPAFLAAPEHVAPQLVLAHSPDDNLCR
jgi:hypothetical protein